MLEVEDLNGKQNRFKEKLESIKGDKEKLDVLVRHLFFSYDEEINERMSELLFYFFMAHGGELEKELEQIDEIRELAKKADWLQTQPNLGAGPIWIDKQITTSQPKIYPQWDSRTIIEDWKNPFKGNSYGLFNSNKSSVSLSLGLDDEE